MKGKLFLFLWFIAGYAYSQNTTFIKANDSWKYIDNGIDLGTSWRQPGFNDAGWKTGNAELGYGDGGEATVVSYGSSSTNKYITTYFRKSFSVASAAAVTSLTLNLLRDDGAVVYLNGTEVYRSNMPAGTISYTTLASTAVSGTDETTYFSASIPVASLVNGTNVLAVEIHQEAGYSSDISFNLSLSGNVTVPSTPVNTTFIAQNSAWKYLDNGTDQASSWTGLAFNDAGWKTGNAELGYGDGGEATVVSYGASSTNKYITTYFRKSFTVSNAASVSALTLNILRDDGAVVYLNGVEVYRTNMPSGSISYNTLASTAIGGTDETTYYSASIPVTSLVTGTNVLAVEIHQEAGYSSDISFNLSLTGVVGSTTSSVGNSTLVSKNSTWKYLDNGIDQGVNWRASSFNDGSWKSGNGELGYGDGGEATVISAGSTAGSSNMTTYFRKSFQVSDPSVFSQLELSILRDDGAVVYLNGTEVYRTNMPGGTISYATGAYSSVMEGNEGVYYTGYISTSLLVPGNNVIAVEVHQYNASSSDLSFDLGLIGIGINSSTNPDGVALQRGPYLQLGTPTSVYLKWRTNIPSNSKIMYGTSPSTLTSTVSSANLVTDHEMMLSGLKPATKYYYSVGTSSGKLQGDANNFFITGPATGTAKKTRIWAIGDAGSNYVEQNMVRDAYLAYTGTVPTDVWLWLGDNAYEKGADDEYQSNVFMNHYENIFKNTVSWPTPGNHDYANIGYQSPQALASTFTYFDVFKVPTAGEAGGVASGTEHYYSFNYSNIHFISLDSYGSYNNSTSDMVNWLTKDLAANTQRWVVVYMHHPPYSKGAHDSDKEKELVAMRTNVVPVLEKYKVDLVLSGHSHSYERSYLIQGHFGLESTFTDSMKINGGSGRLPTPYNKNAPDYKGTVYTVLGCSGKLDGTSPGWPHNAMYYSINTRYGSMVIDVDGNILTGRFIDKDKNIMDEFTIQKDVTSAARAEISLPAEPEVQDEDLLSVSPNPFSKETKITYTLTGDKMVSLELYNQLGAKVHTFFSGEIQKAGQYEFLFSPEQAGAKAGLYYIKLIIDNKVISKKIVQAD